VPQGKARIRAIVTAGHTSDQLDRAAEIFSKIAKKLQIIP
jgi:glycine C-acetyltransferase